MALASTANPRPHCQRSSFAYTAKPNLKQSSTAENWLVGPEKNTDSAAGTGPAVSRDAQSSRLLQRVNGNFAESQILGLRPPRPKGMRTVTRIQYSPPQGPTSLFTIFRAPRKLS